MKDLFGLCYGTCGAADYTIVTIIGTMVLGLGSLLLYIAYNVIDEHFSPEYISDAEVIGKAQEYEPSSTSMVPVSSGKTTTIVPITTPGRMRYRVVVKITDPEAMIDGKVTEADTRLRDFVRMNQGDKVRVSWGIGALSRKWFVRFAMVVGEA